MMFFLPGLYFKIKFQIYNFPKLQKMIEISSTKNHLRIIMQQKKKS